MKYINLNFNSDIQFKLEQLKYKLNHFSCGEFEFSIQEDITNCEIKIFQSFSVGKFNDDLMKLQIVCDVLKRNHVKKITYFAPFLPYTRQDRTYDTTSSLGSKIIAEIINNCDINEIITYDLHALQIEGFFKGKVQNLSMVPDFIDDIKNKFNHDEIVIVFPDTGSASRSKRFFTEEEFKIAIINKNRTKDQIKMEILGNVKNRIAIIIDDIIDSGGTIIEASKILLEDEVKSIFVYSTHGIFSNNAIEKIEESSIEKFIISNSLRSNKSHKIDIISINIKM